MTAKTVAKSRILKAVHETARQPGFVIFPKAESIRPDFLLS